MTSEEYIINLINIYIKKFQGVSNRHRRILFILATALGVSICIVSKKIKVLEQRSNTLEAYIRAKNPKEDQNAK